MNKKVTTIFWAEDDDDDILIINSALQECGQDVVCQFFNNGLELANALSAVHFPHPDFIVLDLNMPLLDGCDTLDFLKKSGRLSGHTDNNLFNIFCTSRFVKGERTWCH